MALITTKAIVFSALKYGDTNLIVKCYTLKEGLKSYLVRGVLKSKKGKLRPAYFQVLTQLEITANHNDKNKLNYIKEARVSYPYSDISNSIVKQTISLFLAEVLSKIIQEEEINENLYQFIETSFIWFDTHRKISNFHLIFLINLSRFLGFYPDMTDVHKTTFNLSEGKFTDATYDKYCITGIKLYSFKKILNTNYELGTEISFNKKERQDVLALIIQYFEVHLNGFIRPKSLDVLESVFM